MAEQKTFKYGDKEYLIDDLLRLHALQENNYYNFAKDRGNYDEEALKGLRAALTDRINAVRLGKSFTADGILDGDKVDNIIILSEEPSGLLGLKKKTKYTNLDNTAWAKHYLNKLVSNLKPINTKKEISGYSSDKHSFAAFANAHGLSAKDIFENMDKGDGSTRDFKERNAKAKELLQNYFTYLQGKQFDFSKDDNDFNDNLLLDLEKVINNYDKLSTVDKQAILRRIGAGEAYTTAFTSNRFDLSKSDEQLKAEKDKQTQESQEKQKKIYLDEFEDYAYKNRRNTNPVYYNPFDYSNHYETFEKWYADLNADEKLKYGTYLGIGPDYNDDWSNAWNAFTTALRENKLYSDKNAGILLQGTFESNPGAFVDLGNGNYLIRDSVTSTGQGTVYNPKNGLTSSVFLGDLAVNNDDIKNIYKQLAYKYINNKYNTNYEDRPDVFKAGGELVPKHLYGHLVVYNWQSTDNRIKEKADTNGLDVKTLKAKDKYIDSDNKSLDNPNAGLTAAQTARIGYAAADLAAAVASFVPGYGTAIAAIAGVGSTVGNFISDLSDDAVTAGDAWKNLGMNLGMDALGLIPGGGAASKMTKIVKSLKSIVPYIIAIPGVATMLSNSPEIKQSWSKMFDGGPEKGGSKMTYQDYMNVLQVLNVVTGGATIVGNKVTSAKRSTKQSDKIAVSVKDAQGTLKALVLEGEDVKNFKQANKEGKAQEFIDKLEGQGNFTIDQASKSNNLKFWGRDTDDKFHLFHQNPFGSHTTGKAKTFDVNVEKLRTKWGKKILDENDQLKTREWVNPGKWKADLVDDGLIHTNKTNVDIKKIQDVLNEKQALNINNLQNKSNILKQQIKLKRDLISKLKNGTLTPDELTQLRILAAQITGNRNAYKGYISEKKNIEKLYDQLQTELHTNPVTPTLTLLSNVILDIKRQLNIQKLGGTIDINKLNKFLNNGER